MKYSNPQKYRDTKLSWIESQPKKVVVMVVVVVNFNVVGVVVVIIIFGHRNLTLKFGQIWVNNESYIFVVVIV